MAPTKKFVAAAEFINQNYDFFNSVYWTHGKELEELFLTKEEIQAIFVLIEYSENFVTELNQDTLDAWKACTSLLSFLRTGIFPAKVIKRQGLAVISEKVRLIVSFVFNKFYPEYLFYSMPYYF